MIYYLLLFMLLLVFLPEPLNPFLLTNFFPLLFLLLFLSPLCCLPRVFVLPLCVPLLFPLPNPSLLIGPFLFVWNSESGRNRNKGLVILTTLQYNHPGRGKHPAT